MADFDSTQPVGSDKLRISRPLLAANNVALEDAIGRDHKFPTTYGVDAGEHLQIIFNAVLGADPDPGTGKLAIYPKDNGAGDPDLFCQDENDTVLKIFYGEGGTEMLFIANSAPTGWTRVASRQDNAMLCYAASGNPGNGGGVNPQSAHTHTGPSHTHSFDDAGHTHTFNDGGHTHTGPSHAHSFNDGGHTHTGPSHTHSTAAHTLTTSEIPAHTHSVTGNVNSTTFGYAGGGGDPLIGQPLKASGSTGSADSGNSHSHGNTGSGGTGSTGSGTASGTTGAGGTGSTGSGTASGTTGAATSSGATGSGGTGATGSNTAPYYQEVISCTRDT